jgi:cysteine desulfurase family protein
MSRIYLDNAATTWPKPETVYEAVDRYQRECGAAAGRGAYSHASAAQRIVQSCRRKIAELIGASEPASIAFAFNGTDALNMALCGMLRPGDHVVTTVVEHNSVLRPLRWLEERGQIEVTRVDCDREGFVTVADVEQAIRPETRLVAVIHASNVTGSIQPIAEIGQLCREQDAFFLVDAAQSLGQISVDVKALGVDLLAAPGHKSLLGPLGTGVLYVSENAQREIQPWRTGGTGTRSDEDRHPLNMPERLEAGNLNMVGLAGLEAGLAYVLERGVEELGEHHRQLTARLLSALASVEGVTLYGSTAARRRVGVVSLSIAGLDPREAAAMLDSAKCIQARAGIHCAPLLAEKLGVTKAGGTLRLSVGVFTTETEIDEAVRAIGEIAETAIF